jgi:LysR family transcriptional activator of dmlA
MRKTANLDDISMFVAAAEAGTFSAAAAHLQLQPSTISRSLTRLEKDLDLLLVRRSQRGLSLTDTGKEYLLSCKRALQALREGRELLDQHRRSPSDLLRVACPMTMARDAIAPLLKTLRR